MAHNRGRFTSYLYRRVRGSISWRRIPAVMSPQPVWARSALAPRASGRVKRKPRSRAREGEAETRALITDTNNNHWAGVRRGASLSHRV